jgi:hypothetical protein
MIQGRSPHVLQVARPMCWPGELAFWPPEARYRGVQDGAGDVRFCCERDCEGISRCNQ